MLTFFQQAVSFLIEQGIFYEFKSRVVVIKNETIKQNCFNQYEFNALLERLE